MCVWLLRTRNDLAEALELLKAQVDPNHGQDRDQNQAGSRSASPAEKAAGASDHPLNKHFISALRISENFII